MSDLAAQLKTLKINIFEPFLVNFILNSLPAEYGPFKISCNTHKEEWSITELLTMYVQEEERMKQDKLEIAHLATRPKGKGNKDYRKRQYKAPPETDGKRIKRLVKEGVLKTLDDTDFKTCVEEWSITELLTMYVQEEERMKQDKPEIAHLATRPKGKGNKDYGKRQYKAPSETDGSKVKCFFCKKDGAFST
ncbi:hypothetical protein CRG98_016528 [Punica granatum]|uniref:Uncharacterized protein n=1 Tax=Punica granatum TaxID=22663 RepID=A0A2I0K3F2_PUNGR|nr:hypothetical protein CRG98_016528 [Punica granatum]